MQAVKEKRLNRSCAPRQANEKARRRFDGVGFAPDFSCAIPRDSGRNCAGSGGNFPDGHADWGRRPGSG